MMRESVEMDRIAVRRLLRPNVEIQRLKRERLPAVEQFEHLKDTLVAGQALNLLGDPPRVLNAMAGRINRCQLLDDGVGKSLEIGDLEIDDDVAVARKIGDDSLIFCRKGCCG